MLLTSTFGSLQPPHLGVVAGSALTPALLGHVGVFWRQFVTETAMGLGRCLRLPCGGPQREPVKVMVSLGSHNLLERHALRSAINNRVDLEPAPFRKLNGFVPNPLDFHVDRSALIALLLVAGPAAILRVVIAIGVDALKAVSPWTWPYVGDKRMKVMQPSVADFDPAPAVVAKLRIVRIVASPLHSLPDRVERVGVLERHLPSPAEAGDISIMAYREMEVESGSAP